ATIAGFRARIRYDHTALLPASGNISAGKHYDTMAVTGSLTVDGMLAHLPFAVMPGNDALSTIDIVGFEWLNGRGEPVAYDVETAGGIFHRMGVESLFNPADGVELHVFPNPTSNGAEIAIDLIETGHTRVTVINVLGQDVATLFDGDLVPGGTIIPFPTRGLAPGSYYVMLSTPTIRRVERVEILK
ncbi:MAG: T9SS type A sorting domain-containing protein, partial [Bacteroidota bacterium]